MTTASEVHPGSTMREVLERYPGAQRALFRRYHIGGCSSCGFQMTETLEEVCRRNQNLPVAEVLDHIRTSHEQDARLWIAPEEARRLQQEHDGFRLVDIRSREEWEAARIPGALLLSQPLMQEIMGQWDRQTPFVLYDHTGRQVLDAAAYFLGHGFHQVRCLQGGIDAWSRTVDRSIPRYRVQQP